MITKVVSGSKVTKRGYSKFLEWQDRAVAFEAKLNEAIKSDVSTIRMCPSCGSINMLAIWDTANQCWIGACKNQECKTLCSLDKFKKLSTTDRVKEGMRLWFELNPSPDPCKV